MRDAWKKLRFAKSFLTSRLIHVNLQILYQCNYRCSICDFWKAPERSPVPISVAQVAVISERLNLLGPQIVSIGGGEPMLHPELLAIVRALARYHFPVMITNGSRMTGKLARELFEAGLVEISVSLDYANPAKHDSQRGCQGAYARAIEALQMLQANRTSPEQRVNMISVLLDDNLPEVETLLGICQELGVTYLVTLYSHSRGAKQRRLAVGDISQHLLELRRRHPCFVALRGYLGRFSEAVAQGGAGPCYAGQNLCNIDSQGDVSLCIDRLGDTVGNILNDDMHVIEARLRQCQRANVCRDCWTSCRGSIEAIRHGSGVLGNLWDYYRMTRPLPLKISASSEND
jgi:MoaA/NifB/PqqE/SkfB family radical SAM enzyme